MQHGIPDIHAANEPKDRNTCRRKADRPVGPERHAQQEPRQQAERSAVRHDSNALRIFRVVQQISAVPGVNVTVSATLTDAFPHPTGDGTNSINIGLINVISTDINQAFKNLAKDTDPNMKMTAIIGLEGLQTIMLNGILMFTRSKKVAVKNSKEEALDFLTGL